MAFSARLRDLMNKYGKVALGVHLSVSAASITGLYVAIKNNVDVKSLFEKVGLSSTVPHHSGDGEASIGDSTAVILEDHEFPPSTTVDQGEQRPRHSNRTAELAASSGGALALAILCNKALFPIRVPITIGLTPPIARFLARRKVVKNV
ncbi:uncharacterized protein LOC110102098 [Dendrobium catenatum]|uniref:uncharacterized protein LOC110102098 n=1 Tax=Dendrobium catenatum TaxID=906689 RepID=UPI0009F29E7E|nr:uncharacterized protein LOC110102098 [Dendrobium catenatum]